ncbi:hypothetical protein CDAR_199191 [Caerostris darwini]|uniref:Uncharacterized protein n=1 Tax=Caerostris darwini TaxID=1538125 RepID=A0AAV4S7K8_9ARAC|nr:hypothetical protein CDAR_199191 [Caerostris darwini]
MIPQPEHSKQLQSQAFRSGDHGGQIVAEWRLTTLSLQKWRFSSCSTGTMQRGAILHRVVQSTDPCCYSAGMSVLDVRLNYELLDFRISEGTQENLRQFADEMREHVTSKMEIIDFKRLCVDASFVKAILEMIINMRL